MTAPASARSNFVLSIVAGLCSVALFLPLAWPLLTGRVFVFDDLQNFHLPLRYLYANALRGGHLLLWTPALFGGLYLHGEGQVGMLHPLHLLLYGVLPLGIAFNLEFIANYAAAFAGMFCLLRRLRLAIDSSLFGAMLFAFSGFQLLHHHHLNMVAVIAHLPWLLVCLDLAIGSGDRRQAVAGYAGTAIVLGSELLLGFPQAVWWNLLAASGFAILRAYETSRWKRLAPCALAICIGMMLGAVQLAPTLDAAAHSVRSQLRTSFALSYSLSPWNAVQLWSPYFFVRRAYSPTEYLQVHELGLYTGAIAVVAPIWLVIRRRALGRRATLAAGAAVFAVLAFILALGSYGGLDILLAHVPGLAALRAPARYIVLVQFALAILAALAFQDLVHGWRRDDVLTRGQSFALCAIAAASALTTVLWNTHILPAPAGLPVAPAAKAVSGTAFVVAVTVAFVLAARHVQWAPAALIVITAADLGFWGIRYVYRDLPQPIRAVAVAVPPASQAGVRVVSADRWANRLILNGYEIVPGYMGLYPATEHPPAGRWFQAMAGARWNVAEDGSFTPIPDAQPRAHFLAAAAAERADYPGRVALAAEHADYAVRVALAAEHADYAVRVALAAEHADHAESVAQVTIDEPGHIVVDVRTSASRILALTERFDGGWRVFADGAPAQPVRIGGDFLGAAVEAGAHRIEFRFAPRSFAFGSLLSAVGAIVLIVAVAVMFRPPGPAVQLPPAS